MAGTVGDLMTKDLLTVEPSDTLGEAAQKMTERGVGSAVVSDYGRMVGILTERDVMKAVAGRVHSSEARVREWMTADPLTVESGMPAEDAGRIMLEHGFRHLPVVDGDRPVGIISIRDLAAWGIGTS